MEESSIIYTTIYLNNMLCVQCYRIWALYHISFCQNAYLYCYLTYDML